MRKTTISLATFCSVVAVVVLIASAPACGKRGDPLPPLRPFPAAAQGLSVRQIGNRIELAWQAPSQNTDGTVEKLELAEVEVRRRIIDIAALVEEQTKTIEPEESDPSAMSEEAETIDPTGVEQPDPVPSPEPLTQAPPPDEGAVSSTEDAPGDDEPDSVEQETQAPPTPVLSIPNFAPESRDVATLESTVPGETTTFSEEIDPTWIGQRVEYAVVYTNRAGRRGERTTTVQIEPVATLAAPGQPAAETGDGFVTLRWSGAVSEEASAGTSGAEASPPYYSVFRRAESAENYPSRPLNREPLVERELVDRSITFGVGACYVVKQVAAPPATPEESTESSELVPELVPELIPELIEEAIEEAIEQLESTVAPQVPSVIVPEIPPLKNAVLIESQPSPEVCLVPIDTFAPPAPSGLVAVRSGGDVLLTWTDLERADVAGYHVYRGESAQGPFERLNDTPLRVPTYTDDTAAAGATYYYGITAVDDAPAANESEMSGLSDVTFGRR